MGCLLICLAVIGVIVAINKLVCFWCTSNVCLVGKTALITGGASGIGYNAALALASKGCKVIIADIVDTTKAVQDIITTTNNPHILGKNLNLASFKSVRALAKDICESEPRLDILVNNAGTGNVNISYTEDGLERTMQTNYYGHFLLTHLLIDLLKKSAPSRIVFTSSLLGYVSDLTLENLNPKENYGSPKHVLLSGGTYGASKLCLAVASKIFGEKLKDTGVIANAFHPGGAKTYIFYKDDIKTWRDYTRVLFGLVIWFYGKTAQEGAQTLIHLAHADEVKDTTAKFFMEGRAICQPFQMRDMTFCEQIWDRSVLYTKLEPHEIKC